MYNANGRKFGFWVKRNTWENFIAQVISIEGVIEGEKIPGKGPYYGNPKVYMNFYQSKSKELCNSENFKGVQLLSCPGNYSYSMED